MVLSQKKGGVNDELLSQVRVFKYIGVLLSDERGGAGNPQTDRCCGCSDADAAPKIVVKRELSVLAIPGGLRVEMLLLHMERSQ